MHVLINPWTWTIVSFFFGGIFAADGRRLLLALAFGGKHRLIKFRRDSAVARMRQLERVHGNAYELIRYLGEQGIWLGLTVFLFLGQTYMTNLPDSARLIPERIFHHSLGVGSQTKSINAVQERQSDPIAQLMVAGMYCYLALSIGRLLAMFRFIRLLGEFAFIRAQFLQRIEMFEQRLSRGSPLSSGAGNEGQAIPVDTLLPG